MTAWSLFRRSELLVPSLVVLGTPHGAHDPLEHPHLLAPFLNLQLAGAQLGSVHLKHA